jgi:hypothetical protein
MRRKLEAKLLKSEAREERKKQKIILKEKKFEEAMTEAAHAHEEAKTQAAHARSIETRRMELEEKRLELDLLKLQATKPTKGDVDKFCSSSNEMKLKSLVYESQILIKSQSIRLEEGCRLVRIHESSDVLEEYSSNIILGNGRVEDLHACFEIKKAKLDYHLFETPLNTLPNT